MDKHKEELAKLCMLIEAMSDEQRVVFMAFGEGFAAALALTKAG